MTKDEALKLALEVLEYPGNIWHMNCPRNESITAIKEVLAQPPEERNFCPRCGKRAGKNAWDVHTCSLPEQEHDREKFERYWKKTRGQKKSDRELKRHPLQPQTYVQDSANRHWVTWQAAHKATTPPQREWVGLTDDEREELMDTYDVASTDYARAIEAKLKQKNGFAEEKNT